MADSVVEIFNGTLTYGQFTNGSATVATTNGATQYVIKDVQIESSDYVTPPVLKINNTSVAKLNSNLSGTEIVDINSTVTVDNSKSLKSTILIDFEYFASGGGTYFPSTTSACVDGNVMRVYPTLSTTGVSIAAPSAVKWGGWIGADFYYIVNDGNSVHQLHKRTGGPGGADTLIWNNSYLPIVYDGGTKFYYVANTFQYYVYDATTGLSTLTNLATGFAVGSPGTASYPAMAYCNGFLFLVPSYSYSVTYIINIATGKVVTTYVPWPLNTLNALSTTLGAVLSNDEKNIKLFAFNADSVYSVDFGLSADKMTLIVDTQNYTANNRAYNGSIRDAYPSGYINRVTDKLYFTNTSSNAYKGVFLTYDSITAIDLNTENNTKAGLQPARVRQLSTATTNIQNSNGPSIKMRITGIKTV